MINGLIRTKVTKTNKIIKEQNVDERHSRKKTFNLFFFVYKQSKTSFLNASLQIFPGVFRGSIYNEDVYFTLSMFRQNYGSNFAGKCAKTETVGNPSR